jgi:hypothetical protein
MKETKRLLLKFTNFISLDEYYAKDIFFCHRYRFLTRHDSLREKCLRTCSVMPITSGLLENDFSNFIFVATFLETSPILVHLLVLKCHKYFQKQSWSSNRIRPPTEAQLNWIVKSDKDAKWSKCVWAGTNLQEKVSIWKACFMNDCKTVSTSGCCSIPPVEFLLFLLQSYEIQMLFTSRIEILHFLIMQSMIFNLWWG